MQNLPLQPEVVSERPSTRVHQINVDMKRKIDSDENIETNKEKR